MKLDDLQKTVLYIHGGLYELQERGYITYTSECNLTNKGISLYDQIMAEGFVPNYETVYRFLKNHFFPDQDPDPIITLLKKLSNGELEEGYDASCG